ncbi:non-ribosomal peptide synthetase [Salinarimonas chemoclinalis]|uniref:non-ribosomal peptide synthetase n=1 Tax=Salinarimonas chemoclinalis TaxID=3241599 RepID=UPI003558610C
MTDAGASAVGEVEETFILEGIQQAYWVGQSAALDLSVPATYYAEVDLPADAADGLCAAYDRLVRRHPMLRAVVLPSGEQRVLDDPGPAAVEVLDLRGLPEDARTARREALRAAMRARTFAPEAWPQVDLRAVRGETGLRLHACFALWMMDGWSFHLLLDELVALARDPGAALASPGMGFAAYVAAQQRRRAGPAAEAAWAYWRPRLADFPGPPTLPLVPRHADAGPPRFRHLTRTLPAQAWARLVARCTALRITPSLLACAAYGETLARHSGSTRFAITVLHSGRFRHLPDAARTIGNFGTTILLAVDATRDRPFVERVRDLQRRFWRDAERDAVSGLDVTRALQQRAGSGPGAHVPVTFTAVTAPPHAGDAPAPWLDLETARLAVPQVHLDHQLHFAPDGSAVLAFDHVVDLYPTGFVEALCDAQLALLEALADDEATWQRRDPWPAPRSAPAPAPMPTDAPERLEALFEHAALRDPDHAAVVATNGTLTYGALRRRARAVARALQARGVGRGDLVAVSLEKGWEQVAAVLGTLLAGAAYVPVDPDLPAQRRALLLEGSGARAVLTKAAHAWPVDRWPDLPLIRLDDLAADDEAPDEAPAPHGGGAADLAYVIYTSGSTGTPKGVMIDHRGAWNTIADLDRRFALGPRDRVLALSSLSFDLSVWDLFGTLAAGGTIIMPDPVLAKDASHWRDLVSAHGVTIWNSVPALMRLALEGTRGAVMPSLRLVMLSGDWIPLTLPDAVRTGAPSARIWSLGGATEASIWSVLYPIRAIDPHWRSIPYGFAMEHQSIHVLDADLRPCPAWVPGDIHIGGVGVALGYLGDEARTAASFLSHPATGERLYRTGDRGRLLPDGAIEFLGREDFQVKIQGYRVECAEVEAALLRAPEVAAALVAAADDPAGTRHLVGWVVAKDSGRPLDLAALRARLVADLPAYMVPTALMPLDALPLSDNGKVIRSALPAPDFGARTPGRGRSTPPRDRLEETIAGLWREVLGVVDVDRDDDFFRLGGSSFAGMRLAARLESRFGCRFAFASLLARPTIAGIAEALREGRDAAAGGILARLRPGDARPPLVCVHPIGGNVACYAALARALPEGRAVWGLRAPGPGTGESPLSSIGEMADRYLAEIRNRTRGPIHLLGWSLGGLVVQEMARKLVGAGEAIGLVAMIDSPVPARRARDGRGDDRFARFVGDVAAMAEVPPPDFADLASRPLPDRLALLCEHLAAHGIPMRETDLADVFAVFRAGAAALEEHVPRRLDGELLHVVARRGRDDAETGDRWRELAAPLDVVVLDADHYTIIRPPAIETIAARVEEAMLRRESRA